MITKRTKIQLVIFALITMIGVSFVGARYARLDRLVFDTSYNVVGHFTESGGIFTGAEVSYRGVTVGQVSDMKLTDKGVDVVMSIEKDHKDIPEDTKAVVANRSAVGEQFVDLQPETKEGPYLEDGSDIPTAMTETPIETTKLLTDLSTTVDSVNKQSLTHRGQRVRQGVQRHRRRPRPDRRHVATRSSTPPTTTSSITTALLEDSNTVLSTQIDKTSAIKSFTRDLSLFSTTLANSDGDLRTVIENGSGDRQPAAHLPGAEQGRPRAADQQPGHHRRGDPEAHRRHRDDPGRLPVRRRRRLHRGRQGPEQRASTTRTSA